MGADPFPISLSRSLQLLNTELFCVGVLNNKNSDNLVPLFTSCIASSEYHNDVKTSLVLNSGFASC